MACYFPEPKRTGKECWLNKTGEERDQIRELIALRIFKGETFSNAILEVVKDEDLWDYLVNHLNIYID